VNRDFLQRRPGSGRDEDLHRLVQFQGGGAGFFVDGHLPGDWQVDVLSVAVAGDADVEGRAFCRQVVLAFAATTALVEFQRVDVAGDQGLVGGVLRQAFVDAQLGIDPDRLAQVADGADEDRTFDAQLDGAARRSETPGLAAVRLGVGVLHGHVDASEGPAEHGVEFGPGNVVTDALAPALAGVVFHFAGPHQPHGDLVLELGGNVDSHHAGGPGAAAATTATPGVRGLVDQARLQLLLEVFGNDHGAGEGFGSDLVSHWGSLQLSC